ncbi:MAG: DUF58 domain-containing protein [Actinomycetes bacterium]
MITGGTAAGWRSAPALHRAVLVVGLLLAGSLLTGAAQLVALAAPLLVGTVSAVLAEGWPLRRRARPDPVGSALAPRVVQQAARVPVRIRVERADGAQLAVVRVPDGVRFPQGVVVAVPVVGGSATLTASATLRLWGSAVAARPDLLVAGPDGLALFGPAQAPECKVAVLPAADRTPAVPLPPRAAGLVGVHRTSRPGEGSELLDVREFLPGDRLRRIDWRVSARRGALHVRRTAVDADAEVVLCLDSRYDLGEDVPGWPHPPGHGSLGTTEPGSSLDVSVRACLSLAETFLRHGDRVSLVDLSRPQLSLPRGSGQRQLRRIRRQLAEVAVHHEARRLVLRPRAVPASATVAMVSPMLDAAVSDLVVSLRRRGQEVVVVDVLPAPLRPPRRSRSELLAFRLLMAERGVRLAALERHGAVVVRWDPVAVPVRLRQRARQRRAA